MTPPSSSWGWCYEAPLNIVQEAHVWSFERWPTQSDSPIGIKYFTFPFSHFLSVFLLVSHVCPQTVVLVPALNQLLAFLCSNFQKSDSGLAGLLHLLLPRQDLLFLPGFPAKNQPVPSFSLINLACDRFAVLGTSLCFIIFRIFPPPLIINGRGTHDRILLFSFLKKMFFP